jgi:hypothetical protein
MSAYLIGSKFQIQYLLLLQDCKKLVISAACSLPLNSVYLSTASTTIFLLQLEFSLWVDALFFPGHVYSVPSLLFDSIFRIHLCAFIPRFCMLVLEEFCHFNW